MEMMELEYNICKGCGKLINVGQRYCKTCERNIYTDKKGREALENLLWELHDKGRLSLKKPGE